MYQLNYFSEDKFLYQSVFRICNINSENFKTSIENTLFHMSYVQNFKILNKKQKLFIDTNAEPRLHKHYILKDSTLNKLESLTYLLYKVWPSFNVGLDQAG